MFVEAWKKTCLSHPDYSGAPDLLDKLQPPLRKPVIDALVQQVRKDDSNLTDVWNGISGRNHSEKKESVISMLKGHDQSTARQSEVRRLFADLQKGSNTKSQSLLHSIPLWLAHTEPDSPLVAMLAESDKPELRLLAMEALKEHPTPKNRKLLEKLLKDSDKGVRAAAEKVSNHLKTLSAANPAEFASNASSEKH
jgi:hypothetical protein